MADPQHTTLGTRVARASVMSGLFGDATSDVKIGRYVVQRSLGRGAQGEVFLAFDAELRRRVALKVVPALGSESDSLDEARALASVEHRHVVRVFDVGRHEDAVFLAMAYVEGDTLASSLRRRPGWTPRLQRLMRQAGEGLSAIHDAGLVHRDFKPANVLLDRRGEPRIADLGLARRFSATTGEVVGTLGYAAPEQLHGAAEPRSDQYAYCVTLFEIVAGRLPHHGVTAEQLLQDKLRGAPVLPVGTPRSLARVLRRGLAPQPKDRFADLGDLRDAMDSGARWWVVPALPLLGTLVVGAAAGPAAVDGCAELVPPRWNASLLPAEGETTVALDTINAIGGDFVDAWKEARVEVCGRPQETAGATCLRELAAEFAATIAVLGERPADEAGVAALERLAAPASCADGSTPTGRPRDWHDDVRAAVLRSRVLLRLGDEAASCAVAADAQRDATRTMSARWGESEFAATHQWAVSCANVEPEAALKAAERGYLAALSAEQPQWASAMATHHADLEMRSGAFEESEVWLHHAGAALERGGWPRREHLPFLNVRGNLELATGNPDLAAKTYGEAMALTDRGPERASLAYNRAAALSEFSKTGDTLRAFQEAYTLLREAVGLEHTATLTCAVAVSSLHLSRGAIGNAQSVLDEALQAARHGLAPQAYVTGRLLEVQAILEYKREAFEASAKAASEAVGVLVERRGDQHPATARLRIRRGLALTAAGRPEQAIPLLHAAVASLETTPHETDSLGEAWTALSEARRVQSDADPEGAVRDARRAVELLTVAEGSDAGGLGDAHHQLGLALAASGADPALVRASLLRAVSAFEASGAQGYAHDEVLTVVRAELESWPPTSSNL
ncbi:MAG: protein kinase domain-containing protein [Nannocystales bacterium]